MTTRCPVCGRRAVGKVASGQYFCWDCCVEFAVRGDMIKIFQVECDGSLTLFRDPAQMTMKTQEG